MWGSLPLPLRGNRDKVEEAAWWRSQLFTLSSSLPAGPAELATGGLGPYKGFGTSFI